MKPVTNKAALRHYLNLLGVPHSRFWHCSNVITRAKALVLTSEQCQHPPCGTPNYALTYTWTHSSIQCQRSKITRHTVAPLSSFSFPNTRFHNIHVNIVRPLPPSNGYTYLVPCINRFTRLPEAIPTSDFTAPTVVKVIISGWISRFGSPSTMTTDRGKQFKSNLLQQLMSLLGCTRTSTTSYPDIARQLEFSCTCIYLYFE
uniref:Integrase catalytic domain-containing protein n=1 Tax=Amphimedon queenslandica TaxID=400682 RepID=A0A1X7U984_AMPQE